MRAGESAEETQRKLETRVGRAVPASDQRRVSEFLGEIVGIPFSDEASVELRAARQDPQLMGDQLRRAWEDWLTGECKRRPILLVLEDLQWGDLSSLKLVDAALRHLSDAPFMVLGLSRPEVHDLFPKLWAERDVAEIRLGRLTKKHAAKLVRDALGDELSTDTVDRMVERPARAATRSSFSRKLVRAVADGKGDELPNTVLAMVQARLEGLDVEARRVLRAASVFGKAFWRGGVLALLGGADGTTMQGDRFAELVEKELPRFTATRVALPGRRGVRFPPRARARSRLLDAHGGRSRARSSARRLEWLVEARRTKPGRPRRSTSSAAESRSGPSSFTVCAAAQAVEGNDLGGAIAASEQGDRGAERPA